MVIMVGKLNKLYLSSESNHSNQQMEKSASCLLSCVFHPDGRSAFFPKYHICKYSSFIQKLLL